MKKILLFVLLTSLVGTVCAQNVVTENVVVDDEVMIDEAIEQADSIVAEDAMTMEEYVLPEDPEWYVAPKVPEMSEAWMKMMAPRRAMMADCTRDSIQIYDENGKMVEVSWFDYGDTTRTTVWGINPDGTRYGKSKEESVSDAAGYQTYSATYDWNTEINDWDGTKVEYVYTKTHQIESQITSILVNKVWVQQTAYMYTYDAKDREIDYVTMELDPGTGMLMPSKRRVREYNAADKQILEEQYSSFSNGKWIGTMKEKWEFNGPSNKQTLHEKYSWANNDWAITSQENNGYDAAGNNDLIENYTYTNGVKNGSKKEEYTFNSAKKKTLSLVYTWSNGDWVKSTKELWEFNASNKQTLHEKYSWANTDWAITLQENSGYDAAGNNNLVENYSFTNGANKKGSKKEEYTYNSAKKKTLTIKYKWSSNDWVLNTKSVTGYDAAGNTTETAGYTWKNNDWVGSGTRTLQTFNSNKNVTEKITQTWPSGATDWVNKTRNTTTYEGTRTTQEASYDWSTSINDWVGKSRSDWHYNQAGLNDTIKTYTPNGTEWIFSARTVNTYDTNGTNIMTHNAKWDGAAWKLESMTRTDIASEAGRQTLYATWKCGSDSVWIGIQKDTTKYSATGKTLYEAHYTSWSNNDWVATYKLEYTYDESDRTLTNQRMDWVGNSWQGHYRYEYIYDSQGRQISSALYNGWNTSTSSWIGTIKTETVYNSAGQSTSLLNYIWQGDDWKVLDKTLFEYDASNHVTEQIVQNNSNGDWINVLRYEKAYKGSTLVKSNDYTWLNNAWQYTRRCEQTYDNSDNKLREDINGTWSNGSLVSFTDERYYYDCDFPSYVVQFKNYDGSLLSSVEVKEGKTPLFKDKTPTKPADDQYEYTFKGWDKALVPATADAVYTATFSETKKKYQITFKDEDGKTLKSEQVEYGETPVAPVNPTKTATAEYSYSFDGWDKAIEPVKGEATYTAKYSSTKNKYLITFKNEDGSNLKSEEVEYGVTPTAPTDPTKEATAEYSYTFAGWTPEVKAVTGEATYVATYSSAKRSYTITWKNEDGTTIDQSTIEYGLVPTHDDVTKSATAEYTYTFTGWTPDIEIVKAEASYTATFKATKNKYWITFKDEGGAELKKTEVEYGETPIAPAAPSKQATDEFSYAFAGWDKTIVPVAGEETYTATYSSTKRSYMITWLNDEGQMIDQAEVEYGVTPTHEDAEKVATAEFSYTFAGWTPEIKAVTGEASYAATFTPVKNKYTITFKDEDGTELKSEDLEYGETPIAPVEPTKSADEEYTYTFSGWDKTIVPVVGAETYTATYSKEAILVPTGLMNEGEDARATKVLIDGQIYIMRGGEMFTLDGSAVRK